MFQRKTAGFLEEHECQLQHEEDRRRASPISSPFHRFVFHLDTFKTIYKNTRSLKYYRSNRAIAREKRRHLVHHRSSIHPFSRLEVMLNLIVFIPWLIIMILCPWICAFYTEQYLDTNGVYSPSMYIILSICRTVTFFDMISRFFRGYVIEKTGRVVLDKEMIVKNYLKTYFIVDISNPLVYILIYFLIPTSATIARLILFQTNFVILGRFGALLKILNFILKFLGLGSDCRTCFKLTLTSLFIIHYWCCLVKLVTVFYDLLDPSSVYQLYARNEDTSSRFNLYVVCLTEVCGHFFGVGLKHHVTKNPAEMMIMGIISITGMCFYIYATAKILEFFGTFNISESKYDNMIYETNEGMASKMYSKKLKKKILTYLNLKFDRKYFSEENILNALSEHLRMEVVLYSSRNIITNIQAFKRLTKSTVGGFLSLLDHDIFLTGNVVMTTNDAEPKFFFILSGTCSVVLSSGDELLHLEDGHVFGNISHMIFGTYQVPFYYRVVALEPCEIYWLTKKQMLYCCSNYPDFRDRLEIMARDRAAYYTHLYERHTNDTSLATSEIIQELRKGRILRMGTQRDVLGFD